MVPLPIPEHVLRFIDEYVDSVPQLETLLMMYEEPGRAWTTAEVAARTYIPEDEAGRVLEALHRRHLVASAGPGEFRMQIPDERRHSLLRDLAQTYRANLARVATFIHEKPPASLKEFARAFDLKKER